MPETSLMPTITKENYLKAVYFLNEKDSEISITDLGREMEVSTPTANNMVKKMQDKGWVSYEKYKPLKLTEKGRQQAALIIRKHRLAEMFLARVMGFGWEEVHDIAEELEHIRSEQFFDRMDELLGYPTIDPHGSPIPDKDGQVASKNYSKLSDIQEGQTVRVCSLSDSSTELLLFLNSRQIKLGTELKVLKLISYDKSMELRTDLQGNFMLSREVCENLLVEVV